jgi:hypothetical protein
MASAGLIQRGREVGSVSGLPGRDENDLTAALAYTAEVGTPATCGAAEQRKVAQPAMIRRATGTTGNGTL